jgi:hypothetical protein
MELANSTLLTLDLELREVTSAVELLLESAQILTVEKQLNNEVDNMAKAAQSLFRNVDIVPLAERCYRSVVICSIIALERSEIVAYAVDLN